MKRPILDFSEIVNDARYMLPVRFHHLIDVTEIRNFIRVEQHKLSPISTRPPVIDQIELTNLCNFSCIMCPHSQMTRPKNVMDFNLFKTIIDRDAEHTKILQLHHFGESLIVKNVAKYFEYVANAGITVGLSTNGSLLTKKISKELIDAGLSFIVIDCDASSKETYEKIRVGGNWETLMQGVKDFVSVSNDDVYSVLQFIEQPENQHETQSFLKMCEELGIEPRVKFLMDWAGQMAPDIKSQDDRYACIEPFFRAFVLCNGDVVSCCRDYDGKIVLGNLEEQSLEDIWNGPKYQAFRKQQIDVNLENNPLCKNCREWDMHSFRFMSNISPLLLKGERR